MNLLKTFSFFLLFPAAFFGCKEKTGTVKSETYRITGKISHLPDATIYLTVMKLDSLRHPYWPIIDSAVITNGGFEIKGDSLLIEPAWASGLHFIDPATGEKTLLVYENREPGGGGAKMGNFILENSHLNLSGDVKDPKGLVLTGSPETAFNFRWGLFDPPYNKLAVYNAAIDSLNAIFDTTGMDRLIAQRKEVLDAYYLRLRKVVEENTDRFGSLNLVKQNISSLTLTQLNALMGLLDPSLKELPSAKAVQLYIEQQKAFEVNGRFPDTSYTDSSGKVTKLSDIKGNSHTLVIFWASWCKPCREEIPELKKLHARLAGTGVAFVSITIDREKDRWIRALRKENMEWVNLSGFGLENGDVQENNNVRYVPKMYLLDARLNVLSNSLRSVDGVESTLVTLGVLRK